MPKKRQQSNLDHLNHLSRQAIDSSRAEARKRAKSDLTKLLKRRAILVLSESTTPDSEERRKASNAIRELDECLLTLRHQLKHFKMASNLARVKWSKSPIPSSLSDKTAKVTSAKPYSR